jgi:hypothetical protein
MSSGGSFNLEPAATAKAKVSTVAAGSGLNDDPGTNAVISTHRSIEKPTDHKVLHQRIAQAGN